MKQGAGGAQETIYKQICHEHCGAFFVRFCHVMSWGECSICHHSCRCHKQQSYQLKEISQRIEVRDLKLFIEELCYELDQITDICVQFGCYLKKSAITPFNDALDDHIELCIKIEKSKLIPNQSIIHNLKNMRKKYQIQNDTLMREMNQTGPSDLDPDDVGNLIQRLFGLKHYGREIQELFDKITTERQNRFKKVHYDPIKLVPKSIYTMYKEAKKKCKNVVAFW